MITANFIHRTFRIKCGNSIGTGFTVDVDGKQYLVTAKHVIKDFGTTAGLEVFGNAVWSPVPAKLVGHCDENVDISILAPTKPISPPNLPVTASSEGLVYGQDLYFLGFPYGVLSRVIFNGAGYPLPLVKRAILSSFAGNVYLLDGHNNPGFSGGPVLFGQRGKLPNCVAAVISGYRSSPKPVFQDEEKTPLVFHENTGIIISYKIELALELIRANPIGPII
ncbi:trypsin-like peptidase domain-containing protein [candidate division KSB1 bacterium]|nr:trypsin-like peptidase domain-containing protein [candidate division KSB1 bacterium]